MRLLAPLCLLSLWASSAVAQDATTKNKTKTKPKKDKNAVPVHTSNGISWRVVGGTQVTKTDKYPFFVEWEDAKCGGSLIHDDIVLSAAHCEEDEHPFDARVFMLGIESETGLFRTVEKQVSHPLYQKDVRKDYDYMILKLHTSALVDENGNPTGASTIQLNTDRNVPEVGEPLQAVGYGYTSENAGSTSDVLNEATIYNFGDDVCRSQYGSAQFVSDLMFCAGVEGGGTDTCQGDSGGPIIDKDSGKQVGVVSYGVGCARENYGGVNARVSSAIEWIETQVCALSSYPPPGCASVPSRDPIGSGSGNVAINIQHDNYAAEIAWSFTYEGNDQQLFFQAFENDVPDMSLQEESFNDLPAGSYKLRIADQGGDGNCCMYGDGSIEVVDLNSGQTIFTNNGQFGTYLEVSLTVDESGNVEFEGETSDYVSSAEAEPEVKNYPQRVDQFWPGPRPEETNAINVVVRFDTSPQEVTWELSQQSGGGWTSLKSFNGAFEGVANELIVTPFTDLTEGWYRFTISDSGGNGICCSNRRGWVALNAYLLATRRSGRAWGSSGEFGSGTEVYLQMNSRGFINRISTDPPPAAA